MKIPLTLILFLAFGSQLRSEETRIAVVNVMALDNASELLLLKSDDGKKLTERKLVVDKLYEESKKIKGIDENALCSESVTLNKSIDGEKQRVLLSYIKKVTEGKYAIVINNSGAVAWKSPNVIIVDVTVDVKELINKP